MKRPRLVGAIIGFVAGVALGIGFTIQDEGTKLSTRMMIGLATGALGALLGSITGVTGMAGSPVGVAPAPEVKERKTKQTRSTFWVVSTHVLTTGFAIPALAGVASYVIVQQGDLRDPWAVLGIHAGLAVVAYVGGTYYSLSFLKGTAEHERWTDCTRPAVITFTILAVLGFAWGVWQLPERSALTIGPLAICYIAIVAAFTAITASGFARMSQSNSPS